MESATTLRFSSEVLSGNWDALTAGRADLVIGAGANAEPTGPYRSQAIGATQFGFCVAAHHPLASLPQPLSRADITKYCAVVVADTSRNLPPQSRGILADQPTLVMPSMQAKIDAQVRGLGCGYLPLTMAATYLAQGLLVVCETDEGPVSYTHLTLPTKA